ncbi:MAG: hypothetical protein K1X65_08910 [Caldilineales bacterium]|nr:hypothetical protein [Caldilineales bacterium]MCW5857482.1 hypothetical protein [Caldilineales bacterium]
MEQVKVSLTPSLYEFLGRYRLYGFPDKSAMARAALTRLQEESELKLLQQSAELYAQVYEGDQEMQEMAEAAIAGWPE